MQARDQGIRVVAVDRNPDALGFQVADIAEAVDFTDIDAVTEVARRHAVDGALTVSADSAVPVVAAVTERLGLPTIGTSVAQRMRTDRDAARVCGGRRAAAAVCRPAIAWEGRRALKTVGLPAVLKPADSGGQRGVFRLESATISTATSTRHSRSRRSRSASSRACRGTEMNGIVIARGGTAEVERSPTGCGRPASALASAGFTSIRPPPTATSCSRNASPRGPSRCSGSGTASPSPS